MRRWTSILLPVLYILIFYCTPAWSAEPQLGAEAALIMDAANGQVLYEKNGNRSMYPASTTKILTAIIALEKTEPDDIVTVTREACLVDGSRIGLQEGERITMENLLYALMLESANDAAVAIADHIAGSVPEFAVMMNEKVKSLGASSSNFVNPNGLPNDEHFTTARDLAVISRYAMKNPEFRELVSTKSKVISRPTADRSKGPPQEHLWNLNKHLRLYEGATGIKTGYTTVAGECLVASAEREGRELIAVVLRSQGTDRFTDARTLLDYGFSQFEPKTLVETREKISSSEVKYGSGNVTLIAAQGFSYSFPVDGSENISRRVEMTDKLKAPIARGEKLGELVLSNNGAELGRVDLVAANPVGRKLTTRWELWIAVLAALLFAIILRARALARRRRAWRRVRAYSRLK